MDRCAGPDTTDRLSSSRCAKMKPFSLQHDRHGGTGLATSSGKGSITYDSCNPFRATPDWYASPVLAGRGAFKDFLSLSSFSLLLLSPLCTCCLLWGGGCKPSCQVGNLAHGTEQRNGLRAGLVGEGQALNSLHSCPLPPRGKL